MPSIGDAMHPAVRQLPGAGKMPLVGPVYCLLARFCHKLETWEGIAVVLGLGAVAILERDFNGIHFQGVRYPPKRSCQDMPREGMVRARGRPRSIGKYALSLVLDILAFGRTEDIHGLGTEGPGAASRAKVREDLTLSGCQHPIFGKPDLHVIGGILRSDVEIVPPAVCHSHGFARPLGQKWGQPRQPARIEVSVLTSAGRGQESDFVLIQLEVLPDPWGSEGTAVAVYI